MLLYLRDYQSELLVPRGSEGRLPPGGNWIALVLASKGLVARRAGLVSPACKSIGKRYLALSNMSAG